MHAQSNPTPKTLGRRPAGLVTGQDRVVVSDLERTVLDCLKQPEHCGGLVEVAKGLWMRREAADPRKLVDYALRLDVGAVTRRLGYLMELYEIGSPAEVERLRGHLTAGYALLDPVLPPGGRHLRRWRVRLNVAPDELAVVIRT
ncbi:MAG: hypothetical protein HYY04_11555 [Chloroflexi bacterium]|nr:hypothetical protein [Chloroflexota bacterium]